MFLIKTYRFQLGKMKMTNINYILLVIMYMWETFVVFKIIYDM